MSGESRIAPAGQAGRGRRFVILASRFHEPLSRALIEGAVRTLRRHGAAGRSIRTYWVPGAFELPVVAARVARARQRPDAIIALGALIKGQTPQYQVLAHAVASGLSDLSVQTGVPVTFGVVVADTLAQARARRNRGEEAALAALAVLKLLGAIRA
jgi:6,7-dimethyl-8-ribityllumazine synthase